MSKENDIHALMTELYALDPDGIVFKEEQDILLSIKGQYDRLRQKENLIENDELSLNVGLLGAFSSGKSSILNSLINEDLLPINISPTTAFTTKLRYGLDRKMYIVLRNDKRIPINEREYEILKEYQRKRDGVNELKSYIKGLRDVRDIKYIEVQLPLEVLQKVNFYDTPGLESINEEETERASEVLDELDLIFWVLDINQGSLGRRALNFIENTIKSRLRIPVVLILNKVDTVRPSSWQSVAAHINNEEYAFDQIFHYSARKVMEWKKAGKITSDKESELLNVVKEYIDNYKEHDRERLNNAFIQKIEDVANEVSNKKSITRYAKYKWQHEQLKGYIDDIRRKVGEYKRKEIERTREQLNKEKIEIEHRIRDKVNTLNNRIRKNYAEIRKVKRRFNNRLERVFKNETPAFRDHVFSYFRDNLFDLGSYPVRTKELSDEEWEKLYENFQNYVAEFGQDLWEKVYSVLPDGEDKHDNFDKLIDKLAEFDFSDDATENDPRWERFWEHLFLINNFFIESTWNGVVAVGRTINDWASELLNFFDAYDVPDLSNKIDWNVIEKELTTIIDIAISDEKYVDLLKAIFSQFFEERINMVNAGYKKAEDKIKRLEEVL